MKYKYKTTDFYLASYLLSKDVPIDDCVPESQGKFTFVFVKTNNFDRLMNDFFKLKAKVEPLSYASAQKKLKHMIYFQK